MRKTEASRKVAEAFVTRLTQYRLSRGMTQEELASKLGVQQSSIHHWEAGRFSPRPKMYPRIAKVLGVSARKVVQMINSPGTKLAGE